MQQLTGKKDKLQTIRRHPDFFNPISIYSRSRTAAPTKNCQLYFPLEKAFPSQLSTTDGNVRERTNESGMAAETTTSLKSSEQPLDDGRLSDGADTGRPFEIFNKSQNR